MSDPFVRTQISAAWAGLPWPARVRRACRAVLLPSLVLLYSVAASAQMLGSHSGAADPAAEGWSRAHFVGEDLVIGSHIGPMIVGPVFDDGGLDAWEVLDTGTVATNGGYSITLTTEQETAVTTQGFVIRSTMRSLEKTPPSHARVLIVGTSPETTSARWVMIVGAQTDGDPWVGVQGGGSAALEGAGPGYHTFEMRLDPQSSPLATVSIDGQVVLTDQPSVSAEGNKPRFIYFGSWDNSSIAGARYHDVEFSVSEPTPVPVLGTLAATVLATGLGAVGFVRSYRRRPTTVEGPRTS